MKYSVVIAEDNRREINNIKIIMGEMPVLEIAAVFSNGEEAAEYLKKYGADILVTDIQMSRMDGIELVRFVKENKLDVKIIVISSYAYFEYAKALVELGVESYVLKPFVDSELQDVFENTIEKIEEERRKKSEVESLHKYIDESMTVLRERFIINLLTGKVENKHICENESILGISLCGKKTAVAYFRVKNSSEEGGAYVNGFVTFVNEMHFPDFGVYSAQINENEFVIVLTGAYDADICDFLPVAVCIKNTFEDKSDHKIYVGFAGAQDVPHIGDMYKESRRLCDSARERHLETAVMFDEKALENAKIGLQLLRAGNLIDEAINGADFRNMRRFFVNNIQKLPFADKKIFSYNYVNMLEIIINEYAVSLKMIADSKVIWEKLENFEGIIDVGMWLTNLSEGAVHYVRSAAAEDNMMVKRIKGIIETRYTENLTLKVIAKELNFSTRHIHRIFARATGKSVLKYLTEYRVEKAKLLLKDYGINEVSEMIGYNDSKYFNKVFKDVCGITIKEYVQKTKK